MKFTLLILNIKDSTSNLIFNEFEGKKTGNQFDVIFFVEWIHMLVYTLHVKIIFQ